MTNQFRFPPSGVLQIQTLKRSKRTLFIRTKNKTKQKTANFRRNPLYQATKTTLKHFPLSHVLQIQTHKRLKRTLLIWTKHILQIFGVIRFIKLQKRHLNTFHHHHLFYKFEHVKGSKERYLSGQNTSCRFSG